MKSLFKAIRVAKEKKLTSREAQAIFKKRIDVIFQKKRNQSLFLFQQQKNYLLTEIANQLKSEGVSASMYQALEKEAARDPYVFLSTNIRALRFKVKDIEFFSQVPGYDSFLKLSVILRDMYADDVAHQLLCKDALTVVVHDFILPQAGVVSK